MSTLRFAFQRKSASSVAGRVLNIGCNTDPAHLKRLYGARIVNCDLYTYDIQLDRRIPADLLFDCGQAPWPVTTDSADLVILGDILEHLTDAQQRNALTEAHRVASRLCITVPNDDRFLTSDEVVPEGVSVHINHVTEDRLRKLLAEAGWAITKWQTVDYVFVPEGYFVEAIREECESCLHKLN